MMISKTNLQWCLPFEFGDRYKHLATARLSIGFHKGIRQWSAENIQRFNIWPREAKKLLPVTRQKLGGFDTAP